MLYSYHFPFSLVINYKNQTLLLYFPLYSKADNYMHTCFCIFFCPYYITILLLPCKYILAFTAKALCAVYCSSVKGFNFLWYFCAVVRWDTYKSRARWVVTVLVVISGCPYSQKSLKYFQVFKISNSSLRIVSSNCVLIIF